MNDAVETEQEKPAEVDASAVNALVMPDWWLERPHALDATPEEDKPTFPESALFREYLLREYDDLMSFGQYKAARLEVMNISEA